MLGDESGWRPHSLPAGAGRAGWPHVPWRWVPRANARAGRGGQGVGCGLRVLFSHFRLSHTSVTQGPRPANDLLRHSSRSG